MFSLFSPADIRRARDSALENLETLILAVCSRLIVLRHHPSFPDPDLAPERHALNCIRVLARLLPYLYEVESLRDWEENFFWAARKKRTRKSALANEVIFDESLMSPRSMEGDFEDAKPLGEELLDVLVDLLFFAELSVPKQPKGSPKVSYSIWQSGVGCNTTIPTSREFENNRTEILRLMLTMASQAIYLSPTALPGQGVKALTYLCTYGDKQTVLSVLCSLLNTVSWIQQTADSSVATNLQFLHVGSEIQPRDMARAIQHAGLQRPQANTRRKCSPSAPGTRRIPYSREERRP